MHLQRQDQEIVIPYSRQTPRTISTIGAKGATVKMLAHVRCATFQATSSAMRTWTAMAYGAQIRPMAMCGRLHQCHTGGLLIAMAIGFGFRPGVGLGSMMHRGGTRRSTTADGYLCAEVGAGSPDRERSSRCMHLRWWRLLGAPVLAYRLGSAELIMVATWAGSPWGHEKSMCPATTSAVTM